LSGPTCVYIADRISPIEDIGDALAQYITDHPETFHPTLNIVAQSMGGLVVRSMIKHNYTDLVEAGYRIDDVVIICTPNHGTYLSHPPVFLTLLISIISLILIFAFKWIGGLFLISGTLIAFLVWNYLDIFIGGTQAQQITVFTGTNFINSLNYPDETPYGIDDANEIYRHITWSIFRGHGFLWVKLLAFFIYPFDLGEHDGFVGGWSVPLQGAKNYGPYQRNHNELLLINDLGSVDPSLDLFTELSTVRSI